jgi:hypothetical protein
VALERDFDAHELELFHRSAEALTESAASLGIN